MPWEKNFDPTEALDSAIAVFWENGYEGTSMNDLLSVMSINRGSFYDTFGGKREVLLEAIDRYVAQRGSEFARSIEGKSAREAIGDFFRQCTSRKKADHNDWGCMAVNLALEISPKDEEVRAAVNRAFAAHEGGFRRIIETGIETGELRPDLDAAGTAKALIAVLFGIRVFSRSGATSGLRPMVDQALRLLD